MAVRAHHHSYALMGTLRFAHPTLLTPYQDLFENEITLPEH